MNDETKTVPTDDAAEKLAIRARLTELGREQPHHAVGVPKLRDALAAAEADVEDGSVHGAALECPVEEAVEPLSMSEPEPEAAAQQELEPLTDEHEAVIAPAINAHTKHAARENLEVRVAELVIFVRGELPNFEGDVEGVIALIGDRLRALL